jgi:hypothetical protein
MRSASNTLFSTLSLILTLLLDEINVGPTLWKWDPHKVLIPTLISPNKRVRVEKRVLLALLLTIYKENSVLGWRFLLVIILLSKFDHKNAILLVSFKKIKIYIIFVIFFEKYYFCYIVGIIEKYKYSLLQYESAKYLLSIPIILIKIKLIFIKIS